MLISMLSILSKNTNLSSLMFKCSLKMTKLENVNIWSKCLFKKGNSWGITSGDRSFHLSQNLSHMASEFSWTLKARLYKWELSKMEKR